MADEWKTSTLGDLIEIKHGFAFQSEFFRDEPPGDVLLTPGNFAIGGGFKGVRLKYYAGPVPDEFILRENDLLVTMTDLSKEADTLGYPALVPSAKQDTKFLHNQRLGKILIKPDVHLDKGFLFYLMCSQEYRHEVVAGATGTTVKHTSPSRILAFRFELPSLRDQRAIAHILGALDDKIELNRRMNETLEAMARALFKSWFVDFDPVRAKAEGGDPGLPKQFADLFPNALSESEIGEIPQSWKVCGLDEIGRFLNGLALQRFPAGDTAGLPVIKIAQLRSGGTEAADRASSDIPPDYIVEDGDVLFSWSGSLECVLWTGGKGALNQHLFKVTSQTYPKWLYYLWIHRHLEEFRHIAASKATTMGHIQRHHLSAAKVVLPPPEFLMEAGKHVSPLIDSIVSNSLQSRTLRETRDALLPKLISGELPIEKPDGFLDGAA